MHDLALIIHFIGLAMGLGTSFAYLFLGIAGSKMGDDERLKFQMNTLVLSRMGLLGLLLLFGSGLILIGPYLQTLPQMPLLIIKLILVLILMALILRITFLGNQAKKGNPQLHFGKVTPLGKISLLIALTIVILAVIIFH